MNSRVTPMQLFRQERHPLVALTTLAFALQLCLVILATALSPEVAAASGLTSLCQSSDRTESLPGAHDPMTCQCGPVCSHGCSLPSCHAGNSPVQSLQVSLAGTANATAAQVAVRAHARQTAAIRAPPRSLI
ncbi:hypothetical protein [Roseibium salinum]|uniref:Uncharacterized protein n=1 Tax=Roseibium salinum TaxID=1604349 RepID=A0ABT3R3D1_9HYPH|nr:hypothetical protein [Roseibium sp. DSM 29163]MCX2723709.1 hypothetical protein [Roseibium sp. DSM 29163]MDN3718436.1 hypothetical protein [Roseibium salinum]